MVREIKGKPVIDDSTEYTTKEATAGATTTLFTFTTKSGKKPYLVKIGNLAAPGGENYCRFSLRVNGSNIRQADRVLNMISDPSDDTALLANFQELPQCADISAVVENTDGSTAYNYTGKVVVLYVDL